MLCNAALRRPVVQLHDVSDAVMSAGRVIAAYDYHQLEHSRPPSPLLYALMQSGAILMAQDCNVGTGCSRQSWIFKKTKNKKKRGVQSTTSLLIIHYFGRDRRIRNSTQNSLKRTVLLTCKSTHLL